MRYSPASDSWRSRGRFGYYQRIIIGKFLGEFIPFVATYLVDFLILAGLLYQVAVAFITPSSANRSLPLRRYVTFMSATLIIQFLFGPGLSRRRIRLSYNSRNRCYFSLECSSVLVER